MCGDTLEKLQGFTPYLMLQDIGLRGVTDKEHTFVYGLQKASIKSTNLTRASNNGNDCSYLADARISRGEKKYI